MDSDVVDNLIVKEDNNRIVRFSDIGRAELGPADLKSYMKMNGVPMVGVVVVPQPGANHIDIADAVYERMETMKKDLPEDVHYNYGFDNTKFIRASINEVESTVYEAFMLVIIIIFLFLRDWRVTLIPCIVIPVSLIGAFFVMYLAGFSINVLSMLAVVLAVGLVVDDAIVMTENIYIRIEKGMSPRKAGIEGSKEIFFAVISTSITLIAVFFPIVFMEGTTGRLFREFRLYRHIDIRRADGYSDARDEAAEETEIEKLVLQKNRAFLRRNEQSLQPFTESDTQTPLDCDSIYSHHTGSYRYIVECNTGRNGSA